MKKCFTYAAAECCNGLWDRNFSGTTGMDMLYTENNYSYLNETEQNQYIAAAHVYHYCLQPSCISLCFNPVPIISCN